MTSLFIILFITAIFAAPDPTKKCNSLANTGTDLCTAYPCTSNSTLPPENERVLPNFPSRFACHVSGLLVFPFTPPPVVDFCQEGTFYYDAKTGFSDAALKFVNNLQPADGLLKPNVTLPFIHTGDRMYSTLGVCFCTNIGIGILKNDAFTTNGMADYLGREIKYVEYGVGDRLTDHWLKGPHHIWMDVETKLPIRAWQPTNGLQVYTKWQNFNESELDIPEYCLKVNCSDSPPPPSGTEHTLQPMAQLQRITPLTQDYVRASNPVPRPEYRGSDFLEMNYKLNQHIVRTPGIKTKSCDQFTNQELVDLSRLLHKKSTSSFQQLYSGIRDRRMLRFNSFDEQEKHWEMEINAVKKFGRDSDLMMNVSRDGKCHETVMWFTHHLTSNAREEVMRKTLIPLLPTLRHEQNWINSYKDRVEREYAEMIDKEYRAQLACTACHFHQLVELAQLLRKLIITRKKK